jgi:hypothetical protein
MPEDIFDEYTLEDYLDDMDNLDGDDYGDEGPLFPGGR